MKVVKLLIPVLIVSILFSGCSFRLASSVDELISPIAPMGENEDVQNALNSYCKNGFSLKTPAGGNFTTAYTFFDYDKDSADEAVVFYEPSAALGTINMALINKNDDGWYVACNVEGDGADIYSVDFCDLDDDGTLEFIVLWDVISNSSNHLMCIYKQSTAEDNSLSLTKTKKIITMNDYIAVDVDDDKKNELVVFSIDSGESVSANAVLYSYSNNTLKSHGNTKLDGHINSYKSISYEVFEDTVYIYADAVKSNGTEMLTEIIRWSDYYDTIVSPFYSYSTGVTKQTTRGAMLSSRDLNGDGKIEVPLDAELENLPQIISAINWKRYENTVLDHSYYSLAVEKDDYQVIIPDDAFDNIRVEYDSTNSILSVKDSEDRLIFNIMTVLKSHYEENNINYTMTGYSVVKEEVGYVYLVLLGNESEFKYTAEDMKSMIKSYKGE